MNNFAVAWATGLVVSLAWGFCEYCNDDMPQIIYDAQRVRPGLLYALVVVYFMFWPASVALIIEEAWRLKRERDKWK